MERGSRWSVIHWGKVGLILTPELGDNPKSGRVLLSTTRQNKTLVTACVTPGPLDWRIRIARPTKSLVDIYVLLFPVSTLETGIYWHTYLGWSSHAL